MPSDRDSMDLSYQRLLANNRHWVQTRTAEDPEYFKRLAAGQSPSFLWIGCSDSRMPASDLTGTEPGEVFVHRNVANMVVHTDVNCMSVVEYAVEVLKVSHVIVCGHYGCGGVNAALSGKRYGLVDEWLRNIRDVYRIHREELRRYTDQELVARRLVELNVIEQVYNLGKTATIQQAWHTRGKPEIHGWVYDIGDGLIRDLGVNFRGPEALDDIFRYSFDK